MLYTTKTGAEILMVSPVTMWRYAVKFGIGSQPGGPNTPYVFTHMDILSIRNSGKSYLEIVDPAGKKLGLKPLYNPDGTPNCDNYPKRRYTSVYDAAIEKLEKK